MGKKIKDKQGATMFMALLLLLVVLLASCVVLTAAASAARAAGKTRAQQQSYLNVSSAAQWLKQELSGSSLTQGSRQEWIQDIPQHIIPIHSYTGSSLGSLLQEASGEIALGNAYNASFEITAEYMGTVLAELTVDTDYRIQIRLTDQSTEAQTLLLLAQAAAQSHADRGQDPLTGIQWQEETTVYTWHSIQIQQGGLTP